MKKSHRKELGKNMKTKHKVTATITICFGFFFAMMCTGILNSKKEVKEVSVDVALEAKLEAVMMKIIDDDSEFAQVELIATTETDLSNSKLALNEATEPVINETVVNPMELVEDVVTETIEDTIVTTLSLTEPEFSFEKVIPKVNEFLNIRSKPAQDAEVVGKLYVNSYGTILERGEVWTKIRSGNVTGYANNDYLYFDDQAIAIAKNQEAFQAVITAGSVNVRSKPTTDSEVIIQAKKSATFIHVPEMDTAEWIAILYEKGTIAYVSKDYIETKFTMKTAVSKEEEEEVRKAAQLAKALQEAKKHKPQSTNRAAISVSDEELYLLATVIAMEALSEPYEGKLAVANVVINRMLDGYWGDSISDVVYAKGQFSGANSGRVERFESMVSQSCKNAAVEALAGNNNIGNYMYFIMKGKANYSSYTKYYILGNHCFYARS
jgi:spore germination cell wall hydrolase CwlJ-like protein